MTSETIVTIAESAGELAADHIAAPFLARTLSHPDVKSALRWRALEVGALTAVGALSVYGLAALIRRGLS